MAPSLILIAIGAPWVGALLVWLIGDRRTRAADTGPNCTPAIEPL